MERSETVHRLLAKIAKIAEEMDTLQKTADNPFYKSKYVPLEEVQTALEPKLNTNGIGISQPLYGKGIATIVSDKESGEWMFLPAEINSEHLKPQDQMGGVTYMKRYALVGLFNLKVGDVDDDGNSTNEPKKELPTIRR